MQEGFGCFRGSKIKGVDSSSRRKVENMNVGGKGRKRRRKEGVD
jgi:hypothetical protein